MINDTIMLLNKFKQEFKLLEIRLTNEKQSALFHKKMSDKNNHLKSQHFQVDKDQRVPQMY